MKYIIIVIILTNLLFAEGVFNKNEKRIIVYERLDGSRYVMNSAENTFKPLNNSQDFYKTSAFEKGRSVVYFRNQDEIYESKDLNNWIKLNVTNSVNDSKETLLPSVSVYPNPAHESVFITGAAGFDIQIYDIIGIEFYRTKAEENEISIDISSFAKGYYNVFLRKGDVVIVENFIKI